MSINQRIRSLRKNAGLSQTELGQRLGLSQANISWMEQEGNKITAQNLKQLAYVFGVSETWLSTGQQTTADEAALPYAAHIEELDELDKAIIRNYALLPPEKRQIFKEYLRTLSKFLDYQP